MVQFIRQNKKKAILFAVILIVLIGLIVGTAILTKYKNYHDKVNAMVFDDIDLSAVSDGVYIGESDTGVIYAKVEVAVENGRLLYINILEHRNERGETVEIIVDHMVQEQRTDVDAIASATNSSMVLRKAVENALTGKND